jgi:hypothetical protein
MSFDRFRDDVKSWVLDWVSQHNAQLGHVPCPFAKQAVLQDKIEYVWCDGLQDLNILLTGLADQGLAKDVLAVGMDPRAITPLDLSLIIKHANDRWLMPVGLVALEDHPDDVEIVAGENMNQGTWAIVLIQSIEKLNSASDILRKQGYYDRWTQEQLDDVVTWRR